MNKNICVLATGDISPEKIRAITLSYAKKYDFTNDIVVSTNHAAGNILSAFKNDTNVKISVVKKSIGGFTLSEAEYAEKIVGISDAILVIASNFTKYKAARYIASAGLATVKPVVLMSEDMGNYYFEGEELEQVLIEFSPNSIQKTTLERRSRLEEETNGLNEHDHGYHLNLDEYEGKQAYLNASGLATPTSVAKTRNIAVFGNKGPILQGLVMKKGVGRAFIQSTADTLTNRLGYLAGAKYNGGIVSERDGHCFSMATKDVFSDSQLTIEVGETKIKNEEGSAPEKLANFILAGYGQFIFSTVDEAGENYATLWQVVGENEVSLIFSSDPNRYRNGAFVQGSSLSVYEALAKAYEREKAFKAKIEEGKMHSVLTCYNFGVSSTSQERKVSITLIKSKESFLPETANGIISLDTNWRNDRADMVNQMTGNVMKIYQAVYGKKVAMDKLIKKTSRLSLPFTNSSDWGVVDGLAIYTGKFAGDAWDGCQLMSEEFYLKGLKLHGFDMKSAAGTSLQGRVGTNKAYQLVVSNLGFLVMTFKQKVGARMLWVDPHKMEESALFNLINKIEKGEFKNTIIVFSKTKSINSISLFGDENTVKSGFDPRGLHFNVMETNHNLHDKTKLSNQILGGCMDSPMFSETIKEIVKENIDEGFARGFSGSLSKISDLPSMDFVEDIVGKISDSYAWSNPVIARNLLVKAATSGKEMANNLNFKVDGFYAKILPDIGTLFREELLNPGEIMIPGKKGYELAGKRAVVVRHPKMSTREHYKVVVVTVRDILKRIRFAYKNGKIGKESMDLLMELVGSIKEGAIMVPSSDPTLAAKLGGADYDGDGVAVITDSRIVRLYDDIKEGAINFGEKYKAENPIMVDFNNRCIDVAFYAMSSNGNEPVGLVVTFGFMIMSLIIEIKKGYLTQEKWNKIYSVLAFKAKQNKDSNAEDFFSSCNEEESEAYLLTKLTEDENYPVDAKAVEDVVKYHSKYNMSNLNNFYNLLLDLEICMSSVVGRTIDAVKTGEQVFVPCAFLRSYFKAGMSLDISFNKETRKFNLPATGLDLVNLVYITKDPLYQTKKMAMDYISKKLDDGLSTVEKVANKNVKRVDLGWKLATTVYLNRIATLLTKNDIDGGETGEISPVSILKPYISSFQRWFVPARSHQWRLDLLKQASLTSTGEQTRAFMNYGPELLLDAMSMTGKDVVVKERLYSKNTQPVELERGNLVTLENGMGEKVFTEKKIDGTYVVDIIDGKAFAIASLASLAESEIKRSAEEKLIVLKVRENPRAHLKSQIVTEIQKRIKECQEQNKKVGISTFNFDGTYIHNLWATKNGLNTVYQNLQGYVGQKLVLDSSKVSISNKLLLRSEQGVAWMLYDESGWQGLNGKTVLVEFVKKLTDNQVNENGQQKTGEENVYIFGRVVE